MLYLLRTEKRLIPTYDKLDEAIDILNDIYRTTIECFVLLHNDIQMEDGRKVRGRYMLVSTLIPCSPDNKSRGVIFIDEDCTFVEMCTVLVHEFAHLLTGEGHDGKLFNLFKEDLRNKFERRWNSNAERRKD
jgi:hypothetical protein